MRPVFLSVFIGNVRSLPNKGLIERDYHACSILVFTETWQTALTPDSDANLEGFQLLQTDRMTESGKWKGGRQILFVNDRWCNSGHIAVKVCVKQIQPFSSKHIKKIINVFP